MPELQNGAGREAQQARGNPYDSGVKTPPGLKTIDHLIDNGYGIYESRTGKQLMFVPRAELLSAPNPGAYFQAILDGVAATLAPALSSVVELPDNLTVTQDTASGAGHYVIRKLATGEPLKVVPWDNLPSDLAAAAQCMQWHVNDAAAQLKRHQERQERSSAGHYTGAMIGTAVCVAGSAILGWWLWDDPRQAALVGVFLSVGLFWYPRRRST